MDRAHATKCPRCAGRLVAASDWLSRYLTCLMCGFVEEPTRIDAGNARIEVERDEHMIFAGGRR